MDRAPVAGPISRSATSGRASVTPGDNDSGAAAARGAAGTTTAPRDSGEVEHQPAAQTAGLEQSVGFGGLVGGQYLGDVQCQDAVLGPAP